MDPSSSGDPVAFNKTIKVRAKFADVRRIVRIFFGQA
jgi:hypothetical protein